MKILYVHQYFSTPDCAGGTRSYEFAKALVEAGHEVTVLCGAQHNSGLQLDGKGKTVRGEIDGIKLIKLDLCFNNRDGFALRTYKFLKFCMRSLRYVFTEPYDLIFATTTPLTVGITGIAARWFRRKPFVFEVRDLWPELPKAMGVITNPVVLGAMSVLEWMSYRSAVKHIGLSPGIVKGIARRGVDASKIVMIPNGCDLDLFIPEKCERTLEGFSKDDFIAVFTGTHGIANGLESVLNMAAALKELGANHIKILFVGDGKRKVSLVERARAEQLDNCVFWDPMPKRALVGLMQQVDCGLMVLQNVPAFYYGTSPNKFFDYLAAGLPIVNNYPGWVADMLTEHACGNVVQPDDPQAFAEALVTLSHQPEECIKMGKNARALANQAFDRQKLAQKFVSHLESAVVD